MTDDDIEHVIEIVSHSPRKATDGFHYLSLKEFALQLFFVLLGQLQGSDVP